MKRCGPPCLVVSLCPACDQLRVLHLLIAQRQRAVVAAVLPEGCGYNPSRKGKQAASIKGRFHRSICIWNYRCCMWLCLKRLAFPFTEISLSPACNLAHVIGNGVAVHALDPIVSLRDAKPIKSLDEVASRLKWNHGFLRLSDFSSTRSTKS